MRAVIGQRVLRALGAGGEADVRSSHVEQIDICYLCRWAVSAIVFSIGSPREPIERSTLPKELCGTPDFSVGVIHLLEEICLQSYDGRKISRNDGTEEIVVTEL